MRISYSDYYNKVLGGWVGKCAGGILGAPIEGVKEFNEIPFTEDLFSANFPNDDLDLQVVWLDMVTRKGPAVRSSDFATHWREHVRFPWNEYGIATRNIRLGVFPPESGSLNNSYWKASMGCPIRSEIWGMLCPGNPSLAMFYARMDGSLDHEGFSVEAEAFWSACASLCFFERDIAAVIRQALTFFAPESTLHRLVTSVVRWNQECDYRTAMGKIKSYWGDADFTSAPMNVGFTLLALLHSGDDFNCVMEALHMGHDSDCVAATAGALLGIVKGYDGIPDKWKEMVGNELLISKEIRGLDLPATLTGLAAQTCKAGLSFIQLSDDISLAGEWPAPYTFSIVPYHIVTSVSGKTLTIAYENLSGTSQKVSLKLSSPAIRFSTSVFSFEVPEGGVEEKMISLEYAAFDVPALSYSVNVNIDGKEESGIQRGIVSFGSWLMAGPFIEADRDLMTHHPVYPEHPGMPRMPSASYMNHDKHNYSKDFLLPEEFAKLARRSSWDRAPFMLQVIYPESFKINLADYYYGKGERTVYLFSYIELTAARKLWISMGSTSPFKLWVNNALILEQADTSRSWIGNSIQVAEFAAGKNAILLKLDLITDENIVEFGIKSFTGKHPHQEHWELLVPRIEIQD